MLPTTVIRHNVDTAETRAVGHAALLHGLRCFRSSLEDLQMHGDFLRAGALPVGSVEFVREAMRLARVSEPPSLSYPPELDHLLGRRIDLMPLDRVRGTRFIKPARTKLFTGFVWHEQDDWAYDPHDLEQLQALRQMPSDTMVWVSDPVRFQCEWRFYVLDGEVIGAGRYDPDGAETAPAPKAEVVSDALQRMKESPGAPVAWALDVGVLDDGRTVLVEVNDGWALGLYGNALAPRDYLRFLAARWMQMAAEAPVAVPSRPRASVR